LWLVALCFGCWVGNHKPLTEYGAHRTLPMRYKCHVSLFPLSQDESLVGALNDRLRD
jgi:hypothetical protein